MEKSLFFEILWAAIDELETANRRRQQRHDVLTSEEELGSRAYFAEVVGMAQEGDALAALALLSAGAYLLGRDLALPAELREYLSSVLSSVTTAAFEADDSGRLAPDWRNSRRLPNAVAGALNLTPRQGRPPTEQTGHKDLVRALCWARRRDAGETYEAAVYAAAEELDCSDSTVVRAVRRYLPVTKGGDFLT